MLRLTAWLVDISFDSEIYESPSHISPGPTISIVFLSICIHYSYTMNEFSSLSSRLFKVALSNDLMARAYKVLDCQKIDKCIYIRKMLAIHVNLANVFIECFVNEVTVKELQKWIFQIKFLPKSTGLKHVHPRINQNKLSLLR